MACLKLVCGGPGHRAYASTLPSRIAGTPCGIEAVLTYVKVAAFSTSVPRCSPRTTDITRMACHASRVKCPHAAGKRRTSRCVNEWVAMRMMTACWGGRLCSATSRRTPCTACALDCVTTKIIAAIIAHAIAIGSTSVPFDADPVPFVGPCYGRAEPTRVLVAPLPIRPCQHAPAHGLIHTTRMSMSMNTHARARTGVGACWTLTSTYTHS